MKFTCVAIHAVPEGDMRRNAAGAVHHRTTAVPQLDAGERALACTASVISACERTSSSSQSVAKGSGASSELGSIET